MSRRSPTKPAAFALVLVTSALLTAACGPKVGAPSPLKVTPSEQLLARGAYLTNHVTTCVDCHAQRDWSRFSAPPIAGSEGGPGLRYTREMGLPGEVSPPNITPAALSSWSDGELERAITAGVSKDGRALFPMMPYLGYGQLCQDDVNAIIAYLRTMPSVEGTAPPPDFDFPFSLILNTIPTEQPRPPCPSPSDTIAYGKYLATASGCLHCHTPVERGEPIEGKTLAGGHEFPLPTGTVRSANISADVESGIGGWTKETFLARFHAYGSGALPEVPPGQMQTVMPWKLFAGMTDEDLGAIYDYLKTLPPQKSVVERWSPKAP